MNRLQKTLGTVCDNCPLCNNARKKPDTALGRFMSWHGRYCPAWQAQRHLAANGQEEARRRGEAAKLE